MNFRQFVVFPFTLVFSFLAWGEPQKGDLIFTSLPCYACALIEKTTHFPFSHVGILNYQEDREAWTVLMAAPPKVMEVDLDFLLKNSVRKPEIRRLKGKIPDSEVTIARARHFIGTPYDPQFKWGGPGLYCSEYVALVYQKYFSPRPMDFSEYWMEWTEYFGGTPPQGEPGLSPADLYPLTLPVKF